MGNEYVSPEMEILDIMSKGVLCASNETLEKARHIEDVKDEDFVSVNIDGFMRGTGTNSCGPNALKQYRVYLKDELEFEFFMMPVR